MSTKQHLFLPTRDDVPDGHPADPERLVRNPSDCGANSARGDSVYAATLRRLIALHRVTPGLDNTKKLITTASADQWYPDRVIHVAGTNGKGSVCWKIAQVLKNVCGAKVGVFSSPHVLTIRERITIGGEYISEADFVALFNELDHVAVQHNVDITFFEILTVMALAYFYRGPSNVRKWNYGGSVVENGLTSPNGDVKTPYCDYVILETGLGGMLDSTNVIPQPICSVITSIGWDHMAFLGNTLSEIARQKAGILKPGCPVVLGPQALGFDSIERQIRHVRCSHVSRVSPGPVTEMLQEENTRIASEVLDLVVGPAWRRSAEANIIHDIPKYRTEALLAADIVHALHASWKIQGNSSPLEGVPVSVYIDVGHNKTALDRIGRDLRQRHPCHTFRVLCCMSMGRSLSILEPLVERFGTSLVGLHYLNSKHHRTRGIEDIMTELKTTSSLSAPLRRLLTALIPLTMGRDGSPNSFSKPEDMISLPRTVANAFLQAAREHSVLLVCGTFFVVQEVLHTLGILRGSCDPLEVNEKAFEQSASFQ